MYSNNTYVEDVKDHLEILPPTDNPALVTLHLQESRGRISLAILDDPSLYLRCSAAIELDKQST